MAAVPNGLPPAFCFQECPKESRANWQTASNHWWGRTPCGPPISLGDPACVVCTPCNGDEARGGYSTDCSGLCEKSTCKKTLAGLRKKTLKSLSPRDAWIPTKQWLIDLLVGRNCLQHLLKEILDEVATITRRSSSADSPLRLLSGALPKSWQVTWLHQSRLYLYKIPFS